MIIQQYSFESNFYFLYPLVVDFNKQFCFQRSCLVTFRWTNRIIVIWLSFISLYH